MQTVDEAQSARVNGAATGTSYKIVVTGDIIAEWRLAQSKVRNRAHHAALFDTANYMEPYIKAIGAASVAEIIVRMLAGLPSVSIGDPRPEVLAKTKWDEDLRADPKYWGSFVLCAQYPKKRGAGTDADVVWRIKQKIGIDRKKPTIPLDNLNDTDNGQAQLVVVNQSIGNEEFKHGFMAHPEAWPRSLNEPRPDAWLLIEWSRPSLDTDSSFWKKMSDRKHFGGRIVVVVTIEDLRLAGLRVSRGLSWERTLTDLFEKIRQLWNCEPGKKPGPLCGCAHLVVSFGTSGAAIFSRVDGVLRAKLIYDPRHVEDSWAEQYEGFMSGYTRCLTAGIALEMICARGKLAVLEGKGVKAGVIAARRLLQIGFVPIGRQELGDTELPVHLRFPSSVIARVLRSAVAEGRIVDEVEDAAIELRAALARPDALKDARSAVAVLKTSLKNSLTDLDFDVEALTAEIVRIYDDWETFENQPDSYEDALTDEERSSITAEKWKQLMQQRLIDRILLFVAPDRDAIADAKSLQEVEVHEGTAFDGWSILGSVLRKGKEGSKDAEAIFAECAKIVEYGDTNDLRFPTKRVGKLFVTNREELESLTAVSDLMTNYINANTPTPLSIAAFGPPGSGKSFAIKQLAANISPGRYSRVETSTFNLSQFGGPEALAVALQQVRDHGLSGKMPLVFWDEFDTEFNGGMGWLRYFLAPMQDGQYQDGSAVYYVGRAIFVFAGGTHPTMDEFIRRAKKKGQADAEYSEAAVAQKVPDFVSRLKGYVDVPTLDYATEKIGNSERVVIDAATALRRAKLLRGILEDSAIDLEETVPHKRGGALQPALRKRLNVDQGVLAAFLRVKSFRFGARSMESIVKMSALTGKNRYDRSSLPPDNQLDLHVDADAFVEFAKRDWAT